MRWSRPIALSFSLTLWAFFFLVSDSACSQYPAPADAEAQELIENGGYILTRDGRTISSINAQIPFIPASTIKVATALAALELLGPAHRIKTEFYLRDDTILCIKGYGDPFLTSERVADIAEALKIRGLTRLDGIILDDHFFNLEAAVNGSENSPNPYDADNGALSVNFNSVPLIKYDSGSVASPEPQTPVLDITKEIGSRIDAGLHRVNVSAFTAENGSISATRYAAELFGELLRRQGIDVGPAYRRDRINPRDRLVYEYHSRMTVAEMLRECLRYSNNFIANQLFLYCGAVRFGPPATWDKGRRAVVEILVSRPAIDKDQLILIEGSGLSRQNRITPAAMIGVLEAFRPYAALLTEKDGILRKSGTMTGIYGYGGYFRSGGKLDPFIILLNQPRNNRDQVLKRLSHLYRDYREDP